MFTIGLTDHLEGPCDRLSAEIFAEVTELVQIADSLGVSHAWFAEHHAHAHQGHLPAPLLLALRIAGQTRQIQLGTAVLCLNLKHAVDVAEQVAVADILTGGRLAVGFGSGSTPEEFAIFGLAVTDDAARHDRFQQALGTIKDAWAGRSTPRLLPIPAADLIDRTWLAVNSPASARIAGIMGFNVLFSHLRTPDQYRQYGLEYESAGGAGQIAANRPVYVGPDDATAWAGVEPAIRTLWRRFRVEGKIPSSTPEPTRVENMVGHPINFIVGGPESVARQLRSLHDEFPFNVANVELRWPGLSHEAVCDSLRLLMTEVMPRVGSKLTQSALIPMS